MKRYHITFLSILFPLIVSAQVSEINFTHQNFDGLALPRTTMNSMSMKLWDNYHNNGPTDFGTVLEIYGLSSHQTSQLHFGGWDDSKIRYREAFWSQNSWSSWITLLDSKNNVESSGNLIISGTGNHSIGGRLSLGTLVPTPGAILTVGGLVSCREIKVAITAGADYVFNKDYKLMPLKELAQYVEINKRLPEVASESDMKTNGLNVNEFQIKLLQKIEELTLHLIKQNKTIESMQEEMANLKLLNKKKK